jgi:hypothetical protein
MGPVLLPWIFQPFKQNTLAAGRAKLSHRAETDWNILEDLQMYDDSGKAFGR